MRREANALRFAATQRGCAPVQCEIAQSHLLQEGQTAADFGNDVSGDVAFPLREMAVEWQAVDPLRHVGHAHPCHIGDGESVQMHLPCHRVEPRAVAGGAEPVAHAFHIGLGKGLLAAAGVAFLHRIVQCFALFLVQLHAGSYAVWTPAVLAVVAEQARIKLGVAGVADRTGAQGGPDLQRADGRGAAPFVHGVGQTVQPAQYMHDTLAVLQRRVHAVAQQGFVFRRDVQAQHRQFDVMFLESVNAREALCGQKLAIDAQMRIAAWARPVGQFGIDALAPHHQRREEADVLPAVLLQDLRHDAVGRLRLHRRAVVHAMLHAQLDVEQAQKVPDFGGGTHCGLAPAAGEALLDRHRGRYAVHRIHVGPAGRLHQAARIGIEAFEIAALAFVEDDVERQRGFARAADTGDDGELAAGDLHRQVLEVVLTGMDNLNGCCALGAGRGACAVPRMAKLLHRQTAICIGEGLPIIRMPRCRGKTHGHIVFAQGGTSMAVCGIPHLLRRSLCHDLSASVSAFWSQVDHPVAGADYVEVVFDHHQ